MKSPCAQQKTIFLNEASATQLSIRKKEIVGKEIEDPDWVDMTYLVSQDFNFKIYPYDENTLIYSVLDNQSIIDYGTQFMFLFANGFKESEEPSNENE